MTKKRDAIKSIAITATVGLFCQIMLWSIVWFINPKIQVFCILSIAIAMIYIHFFIKK